MGLAILIGMSVWTVGDCGLSGGAVWAIRIREICVGLVGFTLSFIVVHECRRVVGKGASSVCEFRVVFN